MKLTLKALTGLSIGMAVLGSAMTGGQGAYDLRELGGGTQAASTQITVSTAALEDLQQARASFQQATMALKDGMLHASTAELVQRDIATFDTSARATLVHLQTLAHDAPAAARTGDLDALTTRIQAVFEAYRNVLARAGAHTIDQGTMEVETAGMDGPLLKAFTAQEQALTALTSAAVAQVAALKTRTEVALIRFVAVGTFAMVIVLGSLFFTMRTIRRSVGAEPRVLCEAAARIAGGDMTRRISGAHGSIAESLESLRQQLGMLVVSVRDQASRMSTATGQIAAGNRNLSTQTSQQAAALEASAATIEQMTQSVGHNADAARVAAQTATECSRTARAGGDSMQTVVAAMADIKASADRITGLLADIDGIAFQTNLLSLNAAVEAARAGESGRGFAVVAQEVRSLAARSSDLAKQIRTLMAASGERIQAGSDSAVEAGRTIGSLVTQVREVTDLVDKIASAVVEQSTGLVQVNSAMSQLDAATQQNAALVEQAHAASDSLNGAAQSLTESVTMFQV